MSLHTALEVRTKHGSEGDAGQAYRAAAGAARRRSGGLQGEPWQATGEDAGEGAIRDAHAAWERGAGAHTHLPPHTQLGLGQAVVLRSTRSMSVAAIGSSDLHERTQLGRECRREVLRRAGAGWRAQCVS